MEDKKVLIITYMYPPFNTIASLRVASFVKHLKKLGWQPIVVTKSWEMENSDIEEPDGVCVYRTGCSDCLSLFRKTDFKLMGNSGKSSGWAQSRIRRTINFLVKEFLTYPDEYIGWRPFALKCARKVIEKEEKIDLIFSTCLPPTSHLIASELCRESGIPWVAEYRDLWTYNYNKKHIALRKYFEKKLEKRIIGRAKILTTVSEPLARKLRQLHGKPVEIIMNGFEQDDYMTPPSLTPFFSITYTGRIYPSKQDPVALFLAVGQLSKNGHIDPKNFRIRFYGPEINKPKILDMAQKCGISNLVNHGGFISHKEAVLRQQESTVLLLLNWHNPEEKGVYTGKIFEYLGAKRPILAIPKMDGSVVCNLIASSKCGVMASSTEEVGLIIKRWYDEFTKTGQIENSIEEGNIKQFTRERQTQKLASIFDSII